MARLLPSKTTVAAFLLGVITGLVALAALAIKKVAPALKGVTPPEIPEEEGAPKPPESGDFAGSIPAEQMAQMLPGEITREDARAVLDGEMDIEELEEKLPDDADIYANPGTHIPDGLGDMTDLGGPGQPGQDEPDDLGLGDHEGTDIDIEGDDDEPDE